MDDDLTITEENILDAIALAAGDDGADAALALLIEAGLLRPHLHVNSEEYLDAVAALDEEGFDA